jgi:hypothetical protein
MIAKKQPKKQQGLPGSGGSNVSTISTTTYNPTQQPGTSAGNFEMRRYLYESGLQNVFNDYQANIETLSSQEQQQLQDAYYIREMSKKYLGEYASNMGIGDVSGNLLDIYSNYQQNVGEIRQNYDMLELGLQREYQTAQQQAFDTMLQAQYQRGVEELDENAQGVVFNITSGAIPEGMSQWDYISSEFAAGRITEQDYQTIYGTLYSQGMSIVTRTVTTGIQTGQFGTDNEGNKITNIYDYIAYAQEEYKLTDADAKLILDQVSSGTQQLTDGGYDIKMYNLQSPTADGNDNYLAGLNPMTYSSEAGADSLVFSVNGVDYVSSAKDVSQEELGDLTVSATDLNTYYYEKNPDGYAGVGTVMFYPETNSFYIVGKNGKWYRAINTVGVSAFLNGMSDAETGGSTWYIEGSGSPNNAEITSSNGMLSTKGGSQDEFVYMGKTYIGVENSKAASIKTDFTNVETLKVRDLNNVDVSVKSILDKALTQFGKTNYASLFAMSVNFVVFYNGNFYNVYRTNNSGDYKIRPMKLKA